MQTTPKLALATTKDFIYMWVAAFTLVAVILVASLWALTGVQKLGETASFWDEKVYALLFMMAGLGLGLKERWPGMSKNQVEKGLRKSGLYILGIGVLLSFVWADQPLATLGLCMIASSYFYRKKNITLWLSALSIALLFLLLCMAFDFEAFRTGDNSMRIYTQVWHPWHLFRYLIFDGFFPLIPWLSFWLIGQWLGRKPLHKSKFRLKILLFSLLIYMATGVVALVFESLTHQLIGVGLENMELYYLSEINRLIPLPFFMLKASAAGLIILLTFWGFGEMLHGAPYLKPFQIMGDMWLSCLILLMTILGVLHLLKLKLDFREAFYAGLALLLLCGLVTWLWAKNHKTGPLEAFLKIKNG